jgi:phosphatidylglycerophosphatase A
MTSEPGEVSLGKKRKTRWAWAVATFFGAGRMKPGPGSWGSGAAALLWLGAGKGLHLSGTPFALVTLAAALAATAIGIPAATIVERESERQDPGYVVIDEVAGQWLALVWAQVDLSHMLAGFLFFRLFDIVKPPPARQLERLPAGWGIMCDDLAAGVYALLLMVALQHWIR